MVNVAAYLGKDGKLHYIAEEGTTSELDNALRFDSWDIAREEIFLRQYNTKGNGWFVLFSKDDSWYVRDSVIDCRLA